jgi:hypothetical protein
VFDGFVVLFRRFFVSPALETAVEKWSLQEVREILKQVNKMFLVEPE